MIMNQQIKITKVLFLFLLLVLAVNGYSQTYNMSNSPITTCSGTFYDAGGSGSDYAVTTDYVQTFTPSTAGNMLQFVFTSFSVEGGTYDYLIIYDGPTTGSPVIGTFTTNPGTITATNPTGQITFAWFSDGTVTYPGWAATISCVAPPPTYLITNGNQTTCSALIYDSGGSSGNYGNNQNLTVTYCSGTSDAIKILFSSIDISNNDHLYVYDGNSTAAPLMYDLTNYSATNVFLVSSTPCITLVFTSNNSGNNTGWAGTISCVTPTANCVNAEVIPSLPFSDSGCKENRINFSSCNP